MSTTSCLTIASIESRNVRARAEPQRRAMRRASRPDRVEAQAPCGSLASAVMKSERRIRRSKYGTTSGQDRNITMFFLLSSTTRSVSCCCLVEADTRAQSECLDLVRPTLGARRPHGQVREVWYSSKVTGTSQARASLRSSNYRLTDGCQIPGAVSRARRRRGSDGLDQTGKREPSRQFDRREELQANDCGNGLWLRAARWPACCRP